MLSADQREKMEHSTEIMSSPDADDDDVYGAIEIIQEIIEEVEDKKPQIKVMREDDCTNFFKKLGRTTLAAIVRVDNETAKNARLRVISGEEYKQLSEFDNPEVEFILETLGLRMTWEASDGV